MERVEWTGNPWTEFAVGVLIFIGILASLQQIFSFELINDTMAYIGIAEALVLAFFTVKQLLESE